MTKKKLTDEFEKIYRQRSNKFGMIFEEMMHHYNLSVAIDREEMIFFCTEDMLCVDKIVREDLYYRRE